ncbi:MAG: N-acetylmuramoyl-L-alanine amidase [Eubacteriales bacterium]|nr:N-acetylmuramoyl-L-alanine amidase [Eubacteriales bacterium]
MATKIVVDAGHNGLGDPGAVYNGRRESDDALRLALAVGEILSRGGYDVDYTRTGNISQSVAQKAQLANEAGADLFVSIHRNMGTYPGQYHGVQTLLYDLNGLKLTMAENINKNLEGLGFRNINVDARPNLAVLRRTKMPALLVEAGFLDSEKDNRLFDDRFDEIAQAIADGIMDTLTDAQAHADGAGPAAPAPSPGAPSSPAERPLYRVQVGAFYNLQNAVDLEQELKRMGYNTWIVTV